MFDAQRFCKKFLPSGYTGFLGLDYVENGIDDIVLKMSVSPGVCENGLVSKSALTGAADMAAMLSVWVSIDEIRPHATLNLRVEHLEKLHSTKEVFAFARCIQSDNVGARVAGRVFIVDDVELLNFTAKFIFLDVTMA